MPTQELYPFEQMEGICLSCQIGMISAELMTFSNGSYDSDQPFSNFVFSHWLIQKSKSKGRGNSRLPLG